MVIGPSGIVPIDDMDFARPGNHVLTKEMKMFADKVLESAKTAPKGGKKSSSQREGVGKPRRLLGELWGCG